MQAHVRWFALVAITTLLAAWWWVTRAEPAPPPQTPGATQPSVTPQAVPAVSATNEPREGASEVAPARTTAADVVQFTSFDEHDEPIADAHRDGLVLWVRHANGAPGAALPLTASWRKGFGLYGRDVGRTDAAGRFATTVASVEMFEGVELEHGVLGPLHFRGDLLPLVEDPHTVSLVVPDLGALRVRVVDGSGAPVAGAEVKAEGGAISEVPRQHVLRGAERNVATDANGGVDLLVPHGVYEISARAADCSSPQDVRAAVGPNGGDAVLVLLRAEHRIDVDVRVTLPPGVGGTTAVAFTREAPPRSPGMHGLGLEPTYRELFVDRQSERHFVVRAEDVPWRLVVKAKGCKDAVVDVPRGQHAVAVSLAFAPPPPPMARLLVQVDDPAGTPVSATVRVHETPDLVHGSDEQTDSHGRLVIERAPKGRVCVSATAYGCAQVVSDPIDLMAGDHEVRLQLAKALPVSGRVVDARGNGVSARVRLHRPAGGLRGLALGVPTILDRAPTSDNRGTLPDGVFRFADCGPGEHEVWAFPEHGGWPVRKRVSPGVEAILVLGEGLAGLALVQGTVRDAVTRVALADVEMQCPSNVGNWGLRTDAQGHFQFAAQPGELRIEAWLRDYVLHTTPARTIDAGPVVIDIDLPPSPVFFVRVLDPAGKPLTGAEVAVLGPDGEAIGLMHAQGYRGDESERTNAAGRADLRGVPAGAVRLRVENGDERREFAVPANAGRDGVFDVRW